MIYQIKPAYLWRRTKKSQTSETPYSLILTKFTFLLKDAILFNADTLIMIL